MAHFLERLYPYVPVSIQNLGISIFGLAWKRERLGGKFQEYVRGFRERDRWSPEEMQEYVQTELSRVLRHAFEHVPYYRKKWQRAGINKNDLEGITPKRLSHLPVTPKTDLRSDPDSFVAQKTKGQEKLLRYQSSGSTGTPITAVCTADDHRRFIAAREVRSLGWAGTSIHAPRSMIGGRLVVPRGISRPPFERYNWAERQVYFSAYHISPENVRFYVDALNHYQPIVLTGYAHSHFSLARMMAEQGLTLDYEPVAAVLCSEKLTRAMKTVIKRALRTRAYEEYGAVENCVLATECECGRLHVSPDFGIMEIVDDNGHPVPPGVEGRILCTSLLNEAQPLIRYEIGDVGAWSNESCPCGRNHLPVLKEVVGRMEDVIVGPDGRQTVRFHWVFIDLPGVMEGQIIQEAVDRFTINLVTSGDSSKEVDAMIRRRFMERIGNVSVHIQRVPEIPRTDRGKFRGVISKVPLPRTHTECHTTSNTGLS
ncbi:MAG: phenylacetate--CoA ligase family protein [Verrucomicrobia bacterium]|nr:phenylacetate--CoA ligase family protein [Verrucomicrobiota bacterium]